MCAAFRFTRCGFEAGHETTSSAMRRILMAHPCIERRGFVCLCPRPPVPSCKPSSPGRTCKSYPWKRFARRGKRWRWITIRAARDCAEHRGDRYLITVLRLVYWHHTYATNVIRQGAIHGPDGLPPHRSAPGYGRKCDTRVPLVGILLGAQTRWIKRHARQAAGLVIGNLRLRVPFDM